LLAIGVLTSGLATARTLGALIDGGFSSYTATALVFEWGSCLSAAYLSWSTEAEGERGPGRFRRWLVRYRQPAHLRPVAIERPRNPVTHHPGEGNGVGSLVAVFLKDTVMLRRDRGALFVSIVVPLLMITVIAEALHRNKDDIKMRVPVVDEDQGP